MSVYAWERLAVVRGPLKSTGMAELLWQGGRLSSERVRLVPSSENNWPVPAPIHQSDSTWPRGNEWINKGEMHSVCRWSGACWVDAVREDCQYICHSALVGQVTRLKRPLHMAISSPPHYIYITNILQTISDSGSTISSSQSPLSSPIFWRRRPLQGCCHGWPVVCALTKNRSGWPRRTRAYQHPFFSALTAKRSVFVCTPGGYRKVCFTPH